MTDVTRLWSTSDKSMLSNMRRETVKGEIQKWEKTEQRWLGVMCLHDAYSHYKKLGQEQRPQPIYEDDPRFMPRQCSMSPPPQ